MKNFLAVVVVGLVFAFGRANGLNCYSGSSTSYVSQSGCTYCQKTTTSSLTVSATTLTCSTSCTPGTTSALGYTVTTSCCSTDNCNTPETTPVGGLTCYSGSPGFITLVSGCAYCQKLFYTTGTVSASVSTCLSTTCSPGTTTYGTATAVSYCCSTNRCNDEYFGTTQLRCYEGALGSLVSKSGCTSCQKLAYSAGSVTSSVSYCLSTQCTPGTTNYGGYGSATSYCCSTDNCNGAQTIRAALSSAILVAVGTLLKFLRH